MSDGGKGDKRRPPTITFDEYVAKWDAIFPPKKKETNENPSVAGLPSEAKHVDSPPCSCGKVCG